MDEWDGAEEQPANADASEAVDPAVDESGTEYADQQPTLMQPMREGERIASLDVLRGVAILGIFFVNMQLFAMPFAAMIGLDLAGKPASEHWAWAFVRTFFEYKFISMFSLLFGAGLIMQMMRADAAQRQFIPFFLRRLFVLALFGMVHFMFLWYGDILFLYAWVGLIMMFLRRLTARMLIIVAGVALLIALLVGTGCGLLQVVGPAMSESGPAEQVESTPADQSITELQDEGDSVDEPEEPEELADSAETDDEPLRGTDAIMAANYQPFVEPWIGAETIAFRDGPFLDALVFRLIMYGFAFSSALFGYGWHVLAMFCIGAALMKVDFFRPHRIAWQKRMMVWGLFIGLPLEAGVTALHAVNEHEMNLLMLLANVLREPGSVALCLGYVGAICTLCSMGFGRITFRGIANVGRMALSTYLLSTISSTFIMYWWGLGWFGSVTRVEQLGLVVAVYIGLMIFSTIWLIPFRMGPFEWLWRTLSYLRPQPLLRLTR